jgi:hypothetical protein
MPPSYQHWRSSVAVLIAGSVLAACKPDENPPIGETEGTGITIPNVDFAGDTGGEDQSLPTGQCIQFPDGKSSGYWHQCEGWLEVAFEAEYNGKSYGNSDILNFGAGQTNPDYWTDPDNYELPLVAACCGPFDYENPTTQEKVPYVNNCLYDAVQQICIGLPHFLRKQAEETGVGDGKLALEFLADRIERNTAECRSGLWGGGPPGPEGQAINQLSGTSWAPPNTPATIRIVDSEIHDWTVVGDVPELTECFGIYDNDAAIVPTAPFNVPGTVNGGTTFFLTQNGSASASGPWSSMGSFTVLAGTSSATFDDDISGAPVVSGLRLDAGAGHVSLAGMSGGLNDARLVLSHILRPSVEGGEHVVNAGDATFTAALALAGQSRIVPMRNADPMVFRYDDGVWEFDPFELVYDEIDVGQWTLTIDGLELGSADD